MSKSAPLIAIELLSSGIWVGGLVCLAVVARSTKSVLEPAARVALFRSIGRAYGLVGGTALIASTGAGLAIAGAPRFWSGTTVAAVVLAGVLLVITGAGVGQARLMSRLRDQALTGEEAALVRRVRSGTLAAGALRSGIALTTLCIVVLASISVSR